MVILALDTSTRDGSLALARGDSVVATASGDAARTHGERLPGDLAALVAGAGLTFADIDRFAVAVGPGSFTSLRVGIATVQALALVHGRLVAPVSTLDAVARSQRGASSRIERILVWMDGQRDDVFAALYARAGVDAVECLHGPRVGSATDILDAWADQLSEHRVGVIGNGVASARGELETRLGPEAELETALPPLAPTIARMAADPRCESVVPHAVQPLYVRRPDAVLARERRSRSTAGSSSR